MALAADLTLFVASALLLVLAATALVRILSIIAAFLRISEYIAAFTLMAISTSLPELFIGISSAMQRTSMLALGTVVGSNIADLALIGGVIALLGRRLGVSGTIRRDTLYMFFLMLAPIALMLAGNMLSRLDGALLLAIWTAYNWRKLRFGWLRRYRKPVEENKIARWRAVAAALAFVPVLGLLYLSADLVTRYAGLLALDLALPAIFIGLFFVALGTSLPELFFEARAVQLGHGEMALGDLVGSVITNSTLVLGVTALIWPISRELLLFLTSAAFMVVIAFIFLLFVESGRALYWKEGIGLLLLYVLFLMVELSLKGIAF
mgnify:CR=1 FL=1